MSTLLRSEQQCKNVMLLLDADAWEGRASGGDLTDILDYIRQDGLQPAIASTNVSNVKIFSIQCKQNRIVEEVQLSMGSAITPFSSVSDLRVDIRDYVAGSIARLVVALANQEDKVRVALELLKDPELARGVWGVVEKAREFWSVSPTFSLTVASDPEVGDEHFVLRITSDRSVDDDLADLYRFEDDWQADHPVYGLTVTVYG